MGKHKSAPTGHSTEALLPAAFAELFEPYRWKVFYGGRGGGKSRSFARALLIIGTQRPVRVLCAREIQLSIRDSVKRLLDDEIRRLGLADFYSSTDAEIRGANGSLFIFAGLRAAPEKIKSYEGLTHCWIEEAETVSERSLDLIGPTMRAPGSEIWISFNPDRATAPVWRRFVVQAPPGALVRKVGWRDNPWFPEELRKEMEHCRATDPARWAHVWEGEPRLVANPGCYPTASTLAAAPVLRAGLPVPFSEEEMLRLFNERDEVTIAVHLNAGPARTRVWTCDLTHEYVTINGDYRT